MANTNRPQGARPKGKLLRCNAYVSAGVIYPGDFVVQNSSGQMAAATATNALSGVALGYTSASAQTILVADDPDQEFTVYSDGANPATQADIMNNFDITASAGDSTYKVSRMKLASASKATTATLPLKLIAIDARPDNALGTNCVCTVLINNHQFKGGTGTAGV